jgi:uncharacterized membrane protein YhaH (DUF805 family)
LDSDVRAGSSPAVGTNFLTMNKFKKYFEFSGTINGTNYFLRNMLAYVLAACFGFMTGFGAGSGNTGLTTVGLLFLVPILWFSFTTIYKRMNALFPGDATGYTIGLVILQVLGQFLNSSPTGALFTLILLIFGLVLIFKNSNIQTHEG